MYPHDLRTFLHLAEQGDQLARIAVPVAADLELAAIVNRISKSSGLKKVLLFEQVLGSELPVAANLFGERERVAWALGTIDLDVLSGRLSADLAKARRQYAAEALCQLLAAPDWQPRTASRGAWQDCDLGSSGLEALPQVKAWPEDGGSYLTMAATFTRHPDGGMQNCGMYRIQLRGGERAALRCRPGSGAAAHLAAWHERKLPMPVAIALGGPPVLTWAAGATLPAGVEETALCGYLTGRPLELSACRDSDLQVPASADVVIEGVVEPGATVEEGPFGNHTGHYDRESEAPLIKVRSVSMRRGAIFPWTLVGPPPMENLQLARATAKILLPLLRHDLPSVRGLYLPGETIHHRAALVTVGDDIAPFAELVGQLRASALLRGSRLLVVGRDDHAPEEVREAFWRLLNRVDWRRDVLVTEGCLAVDARRLPPGGAVTGDPAVLARVLTRWGAYGLAQL